MGAPAPDLARGGALGAVFVREWYGQRRAGGWCVPDDNERDAESEGEYPNARDAESEGEGESKEGGSGGKARARAKWGSDARIGARGQKMGG